MDARKRAVCRRRNRNCHYFAHAFKAHGRYRRERLERIGDMRTEMNVIGGVGVVAIMGCCMVYSQGWGATQAVTEVPRVQSDDAGNQAAARLLANPPCEASVTDPCPTMLERLCGGDPTGNGGMGGIVAMCDCACGNGWWTRAPISVSLSPGKPMNMHPISETINSVFWRWQLTEIAQPGHVEAGVEMFGLSSWWHAGSLTKRAAARQATLIRELWLGTGIPCPRLVTIAAMGAPCLNSPDLLTQCWLHGKRISNRCGIVQLRRSRKCRHC